MHAIACIPCTQCVRGTGRTHRETRHAHRQREPWDRRAACMHTCTCASTLDNHMWLHSHGMSEGRAVSHCRRTNSSEKDNDVFVPMHCRHRGHGHRSVINAIHGHIAHVDLALCCAWPRCACQWCTYPCRAGCVRSPYFYQKYTWHLNHSAAATMG